MAEENNPPILGRFPKDGGRGKGAGDAINGTYREAKRCDLTCCRRCVHKRCLVVQPKGTALHLAPHRPRVCGCGFYCQYTEAGSPHPQQLWYPAVRGAEPSPRDRVPSRGAEQDCRKPDLPRVGSAARGSVYRPSERRNRSSDAGEQRCRVLRKSSRRCRYGGATCSRGARCAPAGEGRGHRPLWGQDRSRDWSRSANGPACQGTLDRIRRPQKCSHPWPLVFTFPMNRPPA